MSGREELSLEEAIVIRLVYSTLGHPNRASRHLLSRAEALIRDRADEAAKRFTKGLCTKCWGDGWNYVSQSTLRGPCEVCKGTGRSLNPEGEGNG